MGLHCGPVIGGIVGVNLPRCVNPFSPLPPLRSLPRLKNVVSLNLTALPASKTLLA